MDKYTLDTRIFLDEQFEKTVNDIYFTHQPIYGYRTAYSSTSHISRYMITKSILNALNKYPFSTFIDVGGAEGYTANIVKQLFHVPVKTTDLSPNACKRAKLIFDIDAIACDIHNLPFRDNEFDAVVCSETIEHVTDYKKAVRELLRITNKVLIITIPHETPEIVARNIKAGVPHGHIHYFNTSTMDYLKQEGYTITLEKTLSPLLIVPRVIAEGAKKNSNKISLKIYNFFTPVFKKIFSIKTANCLVNLDSKFTKLFGAYGGITFIIEKNGHKKPNPHLIKAQDFTGIKVPYNKVK